MMPTSHISPAGRFPLSIAVAQPPCVPLDVAGNALIHAEAVRSALSRVVVFPELSLTGYRFDASPVDPEDDRLAPLISACATTGSSALAGAPLGDHIGMLMITGEGAAPVYHKMFLGPSEATRFQPGSQPAVIEVDGWRLGLAICKDTGVARHAELTASLGIDGYVAGVLEHRADRSVLNERAARITADHGVWVAMASFAGSTGEGYTQAAGESAVWACDGSLLTRAGSDPGEVVSAHVAMIPAATVPAGGTRANEEQR